MGGVEFPQVIDPERIGGGDGPVITDNRSLSLNDRRAPGLPFSSL